MDTLEYFRFFEDDKGEGGDKWVDLENPKMFIPFYSIVDAPCIKLENQRLSSSSSK